MEIEIVELPRKIIVNKDIRVRALRRHWDEREINPIHSSTQASEVGSLDLLRGPSCFVNRLRSPLRFELSERRT